jgi:LacI family gluconate utilization system Gnt-I transcriptional repressor
LYLLDQGIEIPGQIGLAGFNGVELLEGLPRALATMDACRAEIGEQAAQIILERSTLREGAKPTLPQQVTLAPKITYGDTLRRRGQG